MQTAFGKVVSIVTLLNRKESLVRANNQDLGSLQLLQIKQSLKAGVLVSELVKVGKPWSKEHKPKFDSGQQWSALDCNLKERET